MHVLLCPEGMVQPVRAVRCANAATAWQRETGNVHVSGFQRFLWPTNHWTIHCLADYGVGFYISSAQTKYSMGDVADGDFADRSR